MKLRRTAISHRMKVRTKFPQAIGVKSGDGCGFYVWESHLKQRMIGQGASASAAWKSASNATPPTA